jgi:predicted nucleic acid-binding protein
VKYNRVFLDANIIADIYDQSRPFHTQSKQTLKILLHEKRDKLYTSCDIITTLYYIFFKKDKAKALDVIVQINGLCSIVEFGNAEVEKSCLLMQQNKTYKDLEDTIQYVMAQKVGCDLILSNDKGFVSEEIPLMTSDTFVNLYSKA